MATRLVRGRASGKPSRAQISRASAATRSNFAQLTRAASSGKGRSSGS